MLKLDAFTHIWPSAFYRKIKDITGPMTDIVRRSEVQLMMIDLEERFAIMDLHEGYAQILSLGSPPLELIASLVQAAALAKIGTDSQAELCARYPKRFKGFIATPPMGAGIDAILKACSYAIEEVDACGIQIYSHVNGRPLDDPEFIPMFDYMASMDLPIWIHPARGANFPDYRAEDKSRYELWWTIGWPYETSAAMARLVYSKILDRLPNLKVITHHAGGMIPFFEGRFGPGNDVLGARTSDEDYGALLAELKHRPLDYFRRFVADTATFGAGGAIRLAMEFFGTERIVFASDAPFDPEGGRMYIRETIKAIDDLDVSEQTRSAIYHGNLERLCRRKFT